MIEHLLEQKGSLVIGIDGRCGSGKTTLSEQIKERFACRLFHMDDFYLPMEKREASWMEHACANMDIDRMLEEVVLPSHTRQPVFYQPYRCLKKAYEEKTEYPWKRLTIIEGSYALHPKLRPYYDVTIFVTCNREIQDNRLLLREGDRIDRYRELWIPLEEMYIHQFQIEKQADIRLDTGKVEKGRLYENIIHFKK